MHGIKKPVKVYRKEGEPIKHKPYQRNIKHKTKSWETDLN